MERGCGKDCLIQQLNKKDALDRAKYTKMMKDIGYFSQTVSGYFSLTGSSGLSWMLNKLLLLSCYTQFSEVP